MFNLFIELFSFAAILSSILVITSKNPVVAVVYLVSTFVNSAIYLIFLNIKFVGISYIIVYVGAIAVLFLFLVMMVNIKISEVVETGSQYNKTIPLAMIIALLFLYEVIIILPFTNDNLSYLLNILDINKFVNLITNNYNSLYANALTVNIAYNNSADTLINNFTQIQSLGQNLYTNGAVWLIEISIILLLAMVAPIFMSTQPFNNKNKNN